LSVPASKTASSSQPILTTHAFALLNLDRPGVIIFRGGSYSDAEMLALLDRVLTQSETLDLDRSITVVDQHRIRRRSLPVMD
jgi:hypothetical protein